MADDFSDQNKDYGLPKVDPQPIKRDQPPVAKEPAEPPRQTEKKDKKENKLIIIVLAVVAALVLASLIYLIFGGDNSADDIPQTTTVEDRAVPEPDEGEETTNDEMGADATEAPVLNDEPGSITTISQRTNRYYIFVGSYKFRAYAHRHAEKLAADGFAVKLITPDNWVGMRVAVGNYANSEEAGVDAQQIRSRYGIEVVISKY